jgi:hypothetical protein
MKKSSFENLLAIVMIAFLFAGCDKLEKADDVTFDAQFTVPQKVEVDEKADNPENPYTSLNNSIEAEQNAEYVKYKNKVKKIRVNKITYTISDLNATKGPVTLTSGQAIFFASGGSATSGNIASVSNLLLVNGSGDLEASQAALDNIGEILLENGDVTVVSVAHISAAPVFFHIAMTLHVTVTANALD